VHTVFNRCVISFLFFFLSLQRLLMLRLLSLFSLFQ